MRKILVLFFLALALIAVTWEWCDLIFKVGLWAGSVHAQTAAAPTPEYWCTLPTAGSPAIYRFVRFPFPPAPGPPIGQTTPADITPPIINSIIYSGGRDVLPGNVAIPATTNGVPFTVNASDDFAVMFYQLEVDGHAGPRDGNGIDALPTPFYVRWNAVPAAGPHSFHLVVWDSNLNGADKTWIMIR